MKREQELLAKIAELEARIKALEARPEQHYHYHPAPVYQPATWPTYQPFQPYQPCAPWGGGLTVTNGGVQ